MLLYIVRMASNNYDIFICARGPELNLTKRSWTIHSSIDNIDENATFRTLTVSTIITKELMPNRKEYAVATISIFWYLRFGKRRYQKRPVTGNEY